MVVFLLEKLIQKERGQGAITTKNKVVEVSLRNS